MRQSLRIALALVVSAFTAGAALAQPYPTKPISVIVPYGAGGGTDLFARAFAQDFSTRIKQSVIVENLPGAGGTIAVQKVVNATPDGYTFVVSNGIEFEMQQMADPQARRRSTNLTPIFLFGTQPMVLVARSGLGFKTATDLVNASKAKPGALTLASSGPGTSLYLAGLIIKQRAGIELLDVPYKSAPQIVTDLIAGNVDVAVLSVPTAIGYIQHGELSALGVTDAVRSAQLPNVPSLSEIPQFKGLDTKLVYAIYGPPKLPASIVKTVGDVSEGLLADPAFQARLVTLAITPSKLGSASELAKLTATQLSTFQAALGTATVKR